jgi:hypothetical protein
VTLTIPSGTPLSLGFAGEVTSETAVTGDAVVATLKQPILVGDRVAFPAGSQVHGTFTDVKSASKGFQDTGGALSIQFTYIVAPDGHKGTIAAGFTKVAEGSAAKKGGIIGGSAVGGALLGKALGKSTGGGAAIGAAIGTAVAGTTKGREAKIKAEDVIEVTLEQDARSRCAANRKIQSLAHQPIIHRPRAGPWPPARDLARIFAGRAGRAYFSIRSGAHRSAAARCDTAGAVSVMRLMTNGCCRSPGARL